MPGEDGVWTDEGGDLGEQCLPEGLRDDREAPAFEMCEAQSALSELRWGMRFSSRRSSTGPDFASGDRMTCGAPSLRATDAPERGEARIQSGIARSVPVSLGRRAEPSTAQA